MNELVEYIKSELGLDIVITPMKAVQIQTVPIYLSGFYKFYDGEINCKSIVFAEFQPDVVLSPGQYAKHKKVLMAVWQKPIVFVFRNIKSYNRVRMIAQGINFVVPYSMIYMPDLLIVISKDKTNSVLPEYLSPTAQAILLYYFYGDGNGFSYKELQESLAMPYPTVCRAIEMLVKLNLCKITVNRSKTVCFETDKAKFLEQAMPFMKSPIKKMIYAENVPTNAVTSGISALSEYTAINSDELAHVAISYDEYKKMAKYSAEDVFMPVHIEVWNYSPDLFANNGAVDKISLYLSLRENDNERVQYELTQMLQQLW